jgi:glycerol-3-phosphate dehydrogenase (NAD+)
LYGIIGTAIATAAARIGHSVLLHARRQEVVDSINNNHVNPEYLSKYTLSEFISATTDIETALRYCDLLILAIPAQSVPEWLSTYKSILSPDLLICNTAKGLYLKDKILLSEAILKVLGRDQPYALLSGPSFASEIMDGCPTAVVIVSIYIIDALVTCSYILITPLLYTVVYTVYIHIVSN